jgi:hypothetical protein
VGCHFRTGSDDCGRARFSRLTVLAVLIAVAGNVYNLG